MQRNVDELRQRIASSRTRTEGEDLHLRGDESRVVDVRHRMLQTGQPSAPIHT